jgi:ABC-type branched-subunit amino acid transport system substrate-binding protein
MVELSVEEINNQGGLLGRPIELIILDNKSTPIGSSMAARKAIQLSSYTSASQDSNDHRSLNQSQSYAYWKLYFPDMFY